MKHSTDKIRTSHVGRLSPPAGFEDTAARLARREVGDPEVAARVVPVVAEVVKRQVEIGIDCIGDGETERIPVPPVASQVDSAAAGHPCDLRDGRRREKALARPRARNPPWCEAYPVAFERLGLNGRVGGRDCEATSGMGQRSG
jgi:hypothetical protein